MKNSNQSLADILEAADPWRDTVPYTAGPNTYDVDSVCEANYRFLEGDRDWIDVCDAGLAGSDVDAMHYDRSALEAIDALDGDDDLTGSVREVLSMIDALEDYPLFSDDVHGEVESERRERAWEEQSGEVILATIEAIPGADRMEPEAIDSVAEFFDASPGVWSLAPPEAYVDDSTWIDVDAAVGRTVKSENGEFSLNCSYFWEGLIALANQDNLAHPQPAPGEQYKRTVLQLPGDAAEFYLIIDETRTKPIEPWSPKGFPSARMRFAHSKFFMLDHPNQRVIWE